MSEKEKVELVVIGAGPGGYAAAFRAADLGISVTLIDPEENPGGVCLYRGCIPSKALLHLVKIKEEALSAKDWGLEFETPTIDRKKIVAWKEGVVEKLTQGLGQLSKSRNINYIQGKAQFTSENALKVIQKNKESTDLIFKKAIIATGSSVLSLPDIEIDHDMIWDSSDALRLERIPESLLVIGGGYIGLELGSVYSSLGSEVTVVEMTEGFLPGVDRDLVEIFQENNPFKDVLFETKVENLTKENNKILVELKGKDKKDKRKFDTVLVAVGRKPNTEKLGLEKAGLSADEKGFIGVDLQRRTEIGHIFAIGDITGEPMLAHKASQEGIAAAECVAGEKGAGYDPKAIPAIVFTNPEIAWCGLTQTEAEKQGREVKVVRFPWQASGRAMAIGEESGLTKLLIDPKTGVVLGGGAAGKNAGSLIPEIALAVEMGSTAKDLSLTIHPHPTLSETIMESAELYFGGATHLS
ncbi:MAG: dihydrolipoyl dehydrogenase [Brumimicrobium sp.]|nr:dihydrolipoyl dehydrogenase [Brumimicrobium sp.]